jgi:hypothetical protein
MKAEVERNNKLPGTGKLTYSKWFDPGLGATKFLRGQLAFRLARQNNPDGRISDPDVMRAERDLAKEGPFENIADVLARARTMRRMGQLTRQNYERVLRITTQAGGGGGATVKSEAERIEELRAQGKSIEEVIQIMEDEGY